MRTMLRTASWRICACLGVLWISLPVAGDDALNIDEVRAHIQQQRDKLVNLHLRTRRVTTLTETSGTEADWPIRGSELSYAGTDELLEAFKGDKRYCRVFELDYSPFPFDQPADVDKRSREYLDCAKAWTGSQLLERDAARGSRPAAAKNYSPQFEYRSTAANKARDEFPPSPYLANVGLAFADPTATSDAQRNLWRLHNTLQLLERWPYQIVRQAEQIGDDACLVLEGKYDCLLPLGKHERQVSVVDRLWLDRTRGFAIRKRETWIGTCFIRVTNSDLTEVLPGLWLPKQSDLAAWLGNGTERQIGDQAKPALVRRLVLLFWVVNEVPDDIFDVALTPPTSTSLLEQAAAVHWRSKEALMISEGWAVRDVGTRVEYRSASGKMELLVVQSPRWCFTWRPAQNRVLVQPSKLQRSNGYSLISPNVNDRGAIVRHNEAITAIFSSRNVRLGNRDAERLLVHLPADPQMHFAANLHHADPNVLRESPLPTVFHSRRYWFDSETGLIVARQCGCKGSPAADSEYKPSILIDYPDPDSLSEKLFAFEIPVNAEVTVIDPELGRSLRSEGKAISE